MQERRYRSHWVPEAGFEKLRQQKKLRLREEDSKTVPCQSLGNTILSAARPRSRPNLIARRILGELGINASPTKRTITAINGEHSVCVGVPNSVLVSFEGATTKMELLAVEGVPGDILIGMTNLERLQASIDLGGEYADVIIDGREVRMGLKPESDPFSRKEEDIGDEDLAT